MEQVLPLIPGFVFPDPTENEFHVPHSLNYKNGYAVPEIVTIGKGNRPLDTHSVAHLDIDQWCWDPTLTYGEPKLEWPKFEKPKYEKFENLALAFRAYSVEENAVPTETLPRVRHVNLYFHLEDDTISIIEPPSQNSGFVQGKTLRRHRIPKDGCDGAEKESFWHWKDLNVGAEIWIYGRTYRLASCDGFTREFLTSQGVEVGADESMPADPHTEELRMKAARYRARQEAIQDEKDAQMNKVLDKLGRFLVFDRQVLRFYATWVDENDPAKEIRHFRVYFFLADGTMEVRPEYQLNDGQYHYPIFVSRCHMRQESRPKVDFPSFHKDDTEDCYTAEDLKVGSSINVLGRSLLLYDCDDFTRRYYAQHLGIRQADAISTGDQKKQLQTAVHQPSKLEEVPPPSLIGSPEDTLQSCLRLIPRRPRTELRPEDGDRPLRYSLRLDSQRPSDQTRRFVMKYEPQRGFVTITELAGRNTGVISGRYLGPRRLVRPGTGPQTLQPIYYATTDFAIGALVLVNTQRFVITGGDLYVLRYLMARRQLFTPELERGWKKHFIRQGIIDEEGNEIQISNE